MFRTSIFVSLIQNVREVCLFLYIVYFHGALFLLIYQSGQHMICYMLCIVIYIFHWSLFCFVVIYP